MNRDGYQHFPLASRDEAVQATQDAAGLFHVVACTAEGYDIGRDRMARALQVLAREWPTWSDEGQP